MTLKAQAEYPAYLYQFTTAATTAGIAWSHNVQTVTTVNKLAERVSSALDLQNQGNGHLHFGLLILNLLMAGANAMVLKTGEEGGKTGLVQNKKSQGELGQGEFAPSKPDQEELPQSSLAQEATGRVEEREHKEEEMAGGCAGDDSSGPVNKGIHSEGGHCIVYGGIFLIEDPTS
ncbi:hypothetical protein STEG23_004037 [Scotinomys teguina]